MLKKISIRNIALVILIAMFFALLIALAACGGGGEAEYYLSLASKNWQTYTSSADIPQEAHFVREDTAYRLTVYLDENEEFFIRTLGSDEKFGYSRLFSVSDALTEGTDGSVRAARAGTYALTFDPEGDLTYEFSQEKTAASVTISAFKTAMWVGDVYKFQAAVTYSDGTAGTDVTWTSNNAAVCAVSADGTVTALAQGTAKITAEAGGVSASVDVTVSPNAAPATGVSLDRTEVTLELGESSTLIATVEPQNAVNKEVFWDVTEDEIVTVTQEGVITAVGYGSATVTVSTVSGGFSAQCRVTVARHVSALRLDAEAVTVVANGAPREVAVSFSPADATNRGFTVEVTSGGEHVSVTESAGAVAVQGLSQGEAAVRVVSEDDPDVEASFTVTVLAEGSALASVSGARRFMIKEDVYLTAGLENGTVQSVSWASSDNKVATVTMQSDTSTVKVTGIDFGSAVITATVTDTSGEKYTVTHNILIADEYFFIYGYGLGAKDWDYEDYVTDRNAADRAELLFEEQATGVYTLTRYLTPENGFQIIFPTVGSYVDAGTRKWTKNIPSESVAADQYYDAVRSDRQFVSNQPTYFRVNAAGVYTVTLDLTGASAKVYIKNVSLDLTSIALTLEDDNMILRSGDTAVIRFAFAPAAATVEEKDFLVTLASAFANCADYVTYAVDFAAQTVTVSVTADPGEEVHLSVVCSVGDVDASLGLVIMPAGAEVTPVTDIAFEQEHYYFNVNNGTGNWTTFVKANVNADATVQQVTYKVLGIQDSFTQVDPESGAVTRGRLGTSIIQATAVGDKSVTATCYVTAYSDVLYLTGEFNDNASYDAFDQSLTTLDGNAQYAGYIFTMDSPTHFTLEVELAASKIVDSRYQYGFQIAHLGMDANFSSLIYSCQDAALSKDYSTYFQGSGGGQPSWTILQSGRYILEIDLSGTRPVAIFNKADTPLQKILLNTDRTAVKKGETVKVALTFNPYSAETQEEIKWTYAGNDDYLTFSFDAATKMLSVTVEKSEHADDKTVTLTCTVGDLSAEVTLTVIAEHHLERRWDADGHWDECTDLGCGFTENRAVHTPEQSYTRSDPEGHYYKCSDCGYKSGLEAHTVTLNNSWFDFSDAECDVCGFTFFEIADGKLTRYDANAQWVRLPESVTEIGENVFAGHSEITSIALPGKLTTIGAGAFKNCSGLPLVAIPDSVTKIGSSAFGGVSALILWGKAPSIEDLTGFEGYLGTSFTIPASVKTVSGFAGAVNLTEMVLPENVTKINMGAFKDCTSLRRVTINGKTKSLSRGGEFRGCTSLEYVLITQPFTAQYGFGPNTFNGCINLKAVYYAAVYTTTTHLTKDFVSFTGNAELQGRLYAYAETAPADNNWIGVEVSQYFVGTWHWDESGEHTIDHILIWGAEEPANIRTETVTLFFEDRTKYKA